MTLGINHRDQQNSKNESCWWFHEIARLRNIIAPLGHRFFVTSMVRVEKNLTNRKNFGNVPFICSKIDSLSLSLSNHGKNQAFNIYLL
jgi:hypothetical protein